MPAGNGQKRALYSFRTNNSEQMAKITKQIQPKYAKIITNDLLSRSRNSIHKLMTDRTGHWPFVLSPCLIRKLFSTISVNT